MSTEATPIRGHDGGRGWHLRPRRHLVAGVVGLVVAAGLLAAALVAFRAERTAAGIVLAVVGVAFGLVPFDRPRRRGTARSHGGGLLLPTHPVRLGAILAMAAFGFLLAPVPVLVVVAGPDLPWWEVALRLVGSLVPLGLGVLLLVGAVGGVRSRLAADTGILLTPDAVVLRTQAAPASFGWDDVRGVEPRWTRWRLPGDVLAGPTERIHNWLCFAVEPDAVTGPSPLTRLARTTDPTVDVRRLALEPDLVLAVCRFYLEHPGARDELSTSAAVDRVAGLAHGS